MDDMELCCSICKENYASDQLDHLPRNLNCGHSLCTGCLDKILLREKKCPECRKNISVKQASELPVNYPVLRLSYSFAALKAKTDVPPIVVSDLSASNVAFTDGKCQLHGSALYYMCMKCNLWMCQECPVRKHLQPPKGQCRIFLTKDALKDVKAGYEETILNSLLLAEEIKEIANEFTMLDYIENEMKRLQGQMKEFTDNLQESKPRQKLKADKLSDLSAKVHKMNQSKDVVNQASSITELKTAMDKESNCQADFEKLKLKEKLIGPALAKTLMVGYEGAEEQIKKDLKNLLLAEHTIYATLNRNGRQKFGLVTIRDGQFLLHSLQDGTPPSGERNISFNLLRKLVPRSSPSVFLEFGLEGCTTGRVYIRMFGDTPRGRQMVFFCSGELGPSYRKTAFQKTTIPILGSNSRMNVLMGGDYERNDGTGGRAIIDGIVKSEAYRHSVIAGLVAGRQPEEHGQLGSFYFYLDDTPNTTEDCAFGKVIKGLELLRLTEPLSSACVMDCGLVITI